MKKRSNIIALSCLLVLAGSCKKEGIQIDNAPAANVVVVNASPASPSLDVYIDTAKHSPASVAYLGTTQQTTLTPPLLYNVVLSGARKLDVRSSATSSVLLSSNVNIEAGQNYSVFVYDTTSKMKFLKLKDDLTAPTDSTLAKIRFLNLSPAASVANVDVTLLRTATPADSVTLSNKSYVGSGTPNEDALSAFTTIKGGTYTVKVKQPGTQTVIMQFTSVAIGTNGVSATAVRSKVLTLFLTGGVKSTALTLRSLRHY